MAQDQNRKEAEKLLRQYNEYEEKLFQGGKAHQEIPEHAWGDLEAQIEELGFSLKMPPQGYSSLVENK